MRISTLIKRYGLQHDTEFKSPYNPKADKRYKWGDVKGHVVGRNVKCSAIKDNSFDFRKHKVVFAQEIGFRVSDGNITCYGWKVVDELDYEKEIKKLRKEYEEACIKQKEYMMNLKLKNMEKDF